MAGSPTDQQLAHRVYNFLQDASCPSLEGLYLQEQEDILQLLCSPSELRSDVLSWICSSINPKFAASKAAWMRSTDPDVLNKAIAALGQELLLCKGDDLDLIKGNASPRRQLRFLDQLLTLLPGCKAVGLQTDGEALLNELFSAANHTHLTQVLSPSLDPWPVYMKALWKGPKSTFKPREADADVAALLQQTQTELQQLLSKCDFLANEDQSAPVFSPGALRLAACDLQQLMRTFCHVYEMELKAYCGREPPTFNPDSNDFQRVHALLLACNAELEMLKEVKETSASMSDKVKQLQTQPRYWNGGKKCSLSDQLEKLRKRIEGFVCLLPP